MRKLEDCIPNKCLICGKFYGYGWHHVLTKRAGEPFLVPIDEAHGKALHDFERRNYKGKCPFCGGAVTLKGSSYAYEVTCDSCDFLFDED